MTRDHLAAAEIGICNARRRTALLVPMLRLAVVSLLAGCGFHRPEWDSVSLPIVEPSPHNASAEPRETPARAAASPETYAPPATTYRVVAQVGTQRREWWLDLRPATGDNTMDPDPDNSTDDGARALDQAEMFRVHVTTTPVAPRARVPVHARQCCVDWLPCGLGSSVWTMAIELERVRGRVDAVTATKTLFAAERQPLRGLAAIFNLTCTLLNDAELAETILQVVQQPSKLDLWRAGWRFVDFDLEDLHEFLTLQVDGAEAIAGCEGDRENLRQRIPIDLAIGSTHVARIVIDAAPLESPFDLSQGIARVLIQHPRHRDRFVSVERVRAGEQP